MPKKVLLRGIDERLYAEAKARAAILGITVSEAVNRALEVWLRTPLTEVDKSGNGRRLREIAGKLAEGRERGVLTVANDGELFAFFDSLEEALEWLRKLYSEGVLKNSLIKPLGRRRVEYLEIGGGGDELLRDLRRD
uniref:Uncharacterized protein n=1 Tax=Thermofilum pendens TaxID=2269 RepID=A0A7C4BAA6_THEPE